MPATTLPLPLARQRASPMRPGLATAPEPQGGPDGHLRHRRRQPDRRPRAALHPQRRGGGQLPAGRHPSRPRGRLLEDGETSFFRVNVWRQQAENVAETLTKGTRAIVTGKLRNRSWQTDGGEQRTVTEIEADGLGPSLKWATAKVKRANRAGAGDKGGHFNDEPPF